jgi:hypothetical protein
VRTLITVVILISSLATAAPAATLTWTTAYREAVATPTHPSYTPPNDVKTYRTTGPWDEQATATAGALGDAHYATGTATHRSTLAGDGMTFYGSVTGTWTGSARPGLRAAIDSVFTVSADSDWQFSGSGTTASGTVLTMSIYDFTGGAYLAQSAWSSAPLFALDRTVTLLQGRQYALAVKVLGGGAGSLSASLTQVPEPTALALVALAAPALLRRRRGAGH